MWQFSMTYLSKRSVVALVACLCVSPGLASAQQKSKKKKPAAKPFAWVNNVPQKYDDVVTHATFESSIAGEEVGYCILLPPSYDRQNASERRYSTLYYLHGGRPGSETKALGLAPMFRKAMVAGDVPEMIVVFVNGGPVSHYNVPGPKESRGKDVFVDELIPHVDATYRTHADRDHRGLEGFSQGGRGTARIGFRHPELFCSIAPGGGGYATEKSISESGGEERPGLVFAAGDNAYDLAREYAKAESRLPMSILIHVGTKGFNYENNLAYMDYLEGLGIPFERLIVADAPHSASVIYTKRGRDLMRFHAKNFGLLK